ncbi:MAG: hypothetical protein AAFP82_07065 [Bacteroidota bacterium]
MWQTEITIIEEDKIFKYQISRDGQKLSFHDYFLELQENTVFRAYFNQLLADVPLEAFFWECRAVAQKTLHQDFEFVVFKSNTLANVMENGTPFQKYFQTKKDVVSFTNLGGDAQLVVPTPQALGCYAHLAFFVRHAPTEQQDAFWKLVGQTCESQLSNKKRWWSTSGLGVAWLHLRIDNQPKYYQYKPYRKDR